VCHYSFLNEHFFELWLRSKKKEYMAEGAKLIGAGCATIALAGAGAGIALFALMMAFLILFVF